MNNKMKVTITIVVAVIIAYLGYRFMRDLPLFRHSKVIYTHYRKVNGLNKGSTIFINGVKVGTVKNITLKGWHNVRVSLNINNDIKVRKGSVALLTSSGLLGGNVIYINEGNSKQEVPSGGTIRGEYSGGMLSSLKKNGTKLTKDASESFEKLNQTLGELKKVVDKENRQKIDQMLSNLQQATNQLSLLMKHKRREMESSIEHANSFLANLDTVTTENKASIDSAMTGLSQTMQNFKKVSAELDETNTKLNGILSKIDNGKGSIGKMINDPSLYNNLDSLSAGLSKLVKNINKHPAKYLKGIKLFSIF